MSDLVPEFLCAEDEVDFLKGYLERANEEIEQLQKDKEKLVNYSQELVDLVEDYLSGAYKIDSFTTQPLRLLINSIGEDDE